MARIVYSRHYNIGLLGLERLHPFDSRKYGRAWREIKRRVPHVDRVRPRRPARRRELMAVHSAEYLDRLRDSAFVAGALELPSVARVPWRLVDWCVLRPMRWATMGSIVAAREALSCGLAINLGGGFHHAKPEYGEGFCVYSDIALAVHMLRAEGRLAEDSRVVYVDLDAHQGNGVCHAFMDDSRVFIFDMYNSQIYPSYDVQARSRIDCDVRVTSACSEEEYLDELERRLPAFLDSAMKTHRVGLAIYNAGTDIFAGDPLGQLHVSAAGVLKRDQFVVDQLRQRGVPTLFLLSGGSTRSSYQLIADSIVEIVRR